ASGWIAYPRRDGSGKRVAHDTHATWSDVAAPRLHRFEVLAAPDLVESGIAHDYVLRAHRALKRGDHLQRMHGAWRRLQRSLRHRAARVAPAGCDGACLARPGLHCRRRTARTFEQRRQERLRIAPDAQLDFEMTAELLGIDVDVDNSCPSCRDRPASGVEIGEPRPDRQDQVCAFDESVRLRSPYLSHRPDAKCMRL